MRVDQNLRVVAVEAVDAHLGEAAVLAVVLHAHAGLETQALRQADGIGLLEQRGVEHADQGRGLAAERGAAAGRHHDLIHGDAAFGDLEIDLARLARTGMDLLTRGIVAEHLHLDLDVAERQVLQKVVSRGIGRGAESRADHHDGGEGDVFLRAAIDHMAEDVGIGGFDGSRFLAGERRACRAQHDEQSKEYSVHCVCCISGAGSARRLRRNQ